MQNPKLPSASIIAKRERLLEGMAAHFSGARDLGSLRRDIDRFPEPMIDSLLEYYVGNGTSKLVW